MFVLLARRVANWRIPYGSLMHYNFDALKHPTYEPYCTDDTRCCKNESGSGSLWIYIYILYVCMYDHGPFICLLNYVNSQSSQLTSTKWGISMIVPIFSDGQKPPYVQLVNGNWLSHYLASSKLTCVDMKTPSCRLILETHGFPVWRLISFSYLEEQIPGKKNYVAPANGRFLLRLRMVHFIHHQQWYRAQPRHGTDLFRGSGRCGEENVATAQVVSLATLLWVRDFKN